MIFDFDKDPENPALKQLFTWRDRLVIDCQRENLFNKIGDEICFRSRFITYLNLSEEPQIGEDGKAFLPKGTRITFYTIQNSRGERFYPVYTDAAELNKWNAGETYKPKKVINTFDDLMPILKANAAFAGIVINPMSDNYVLPRNVVQGWTDRKAALIKFVKENQSTYTLKDNGENGTIKVAADVVSVIAGLAATEVKGVSSLNGGITNAMVARRGNKALSKGVRITVEDGIVKVDLGVNLAYGFSIPEVCTTIQEKVKASIETMTGMQVADVNIHVADIAAEEDV